jgi:hypothetical protein
VQADADGQHDLEALPRLLAEARTHPKALVSGAPICDDSMCGFRVYPLASSLDFLIGEHLGQRMDFDTDVMVRLFWRGAPPIMVPVKVTYPADNISNFDMLWDNVQITRMHTRLVISMLLRLPAILKRRPSQISASPAQSEP